MRVAMLLVLVLAAAAPAAPTPHAPPAPAPVAAPEAAWRVERRDASYPVAIPSAARLARVLEDVRQAQGWHGLTEIGHTQSSELIEGESGCRVTRVRTDVQVVVTLPELADSGSPPSRRLLDQWRGLLERLRRHEEGHVALGLAAIRASHDRISAFGPFVDCRAARRALLREEFRLRQVQARGHARYDRETRFGLHLPGEGFSPGAPASEKPTSPRRRGT